MVLKCRRGVGTIGDTMGPGVGGWLVAVCIVIRRRGRSVHIPAVGRGHWDGVFGGGGRIGLSRAVQALLWVSRAQVSLRASRPRTVPNAAPNAGRMR